MEPIYLLQNVTKDVGEIHARLFDHHPFLSGEINYFVKEFEEKRQDKDVEGLFQIMEKIVEIRETEINKAISLGDPLLSQVNSDLDAALQKCNQILEKENMNSEDVCRTERRTTRQKEWDRFEQDIVKKQKEVDVNFAAKEEEIRNYYADLEQKLHITDKK